MKYLILTVCIVNVSLLNSFALESDMPTWMQNGTPIDAKYLYSNASASAASVSEAKKLASIDAIRELIFTGLGVRISIDEEFINKLESNELSKTTTLSTPEIFLSGVEETKYFERKLEDGSYQVYVQKRIKITILNTIKKKLDLSVTKPCLLSVESTPQDAKLVLDETTAGETPLTIQGVPGFHTLKFSKEGYLTETRQIQCSSGGKHSIFVPMQLVTTKLKIRVKPKDARVSITSDNEIIDIKNSTNIVPGRYHIAIEKDGYEPYETNLTLIAKRYTSLDVTLKRLRSTKMAIESKDKIVSKAKMEFARKEYDEVILTAIHGQSLFPNDSEFINLEGHGYLEKFDYNMALGIAKKSIALDDNWDAYVLACVSAYHVSQKDAESFCRHWVTLRHNDYQGYIFLGLINERNYNKESAFRYLRKAADLNKSGRHQLELFCLRENNLIVGHECEKYFQNRRH